MRRVGGWVDLGAPYLVGNEGMKKTRREMRVEEEVVVGGGEGGSRESRVSGTRSPSQQHDYSSGNVDKMQWREG